MQRLAPLLLIGLAACTPQSAEIVDGTGAFAAFMAANTSTNILNDVVDLEEAEYLWGVDCTSNPNRIDDRLTICQDPLWPPQSEGWLTNDGFYGIGGELTTLRGEAIMTMEGDLQIGFHHELPGGERFWFAFVIDPLFQPTECLEQDGQLERVPEDGNWLENWSNDLEEGENGTLYYLNARSYQFNPNTTDETWTLPDRWLAGYAAGRIGSEPLILRTTRYGKPSAYDAVEAEQADEVSRSEIWYYGFEGGEDPTTNAGYQAMLDNDVRPVATRAMDEFVLATPPEISDMLAYKPRIHTNEWRTPDGRASGLDGWGEMHYNWVRIDPGADITVGGAVSGTFHLMFDAQDSQSRVVVSGDFNVDEIQKDRWATVDVEAQKIAENNANICGN